MSADEEMRRATTALYDADAAAYESAWAPALRPWALRLLDALPLAPARLVADAGAGVGSLVPDLCRAAPDARVVALDRSHGMLVRATGEVPRVVGDLERLPLADGCLDVAVAAFVLFHLPDPRQGLRELHRVLGPGGAVGTITWDGEPRFPAQLAWSEELDAHGAARGATVLHHEPVSTPARMERLLSGAGFGKIRTWTARFEHRYLPDRFLEMRTRRGTSARRFASLPAERRRALLKRVRERFAAMGPADFVDRSGIVYATARRDRRCVEPT